MSEYQYYEFLAIDRPLTEDEMADLRRISSRAHITPVSFTNEYNYGDFQGDPEKLMQRFFDAHVYVANWMTAIFMVRLPLEALAQETAQAMAESGVLDFTANQTHWVITWRLEESENYSRFNGEDGRSWMARLAPLRDELLSGDLRGLYIGWLAALDGEMMDDDEREPISVTGLGSLTSAQQALAEFLEVDEDLLAGAGMGSPAAPDEGLSQQQVEAWIDGLAPDEVTAILKQLLDGRGRQAERTLKNRFAAWRRGLRGDDGGAPRRSRGELLANAQAAEKIRLEKEKRQEKQREARRRKEREASLKNLSKDFPKAWKEVQLTVERGSGRAYDDACRALVDLSEAYKLHASNMKFQDDLKEFMADHTRRKALVKRLAEAGLWKDE
ncbi:MAG: hypothetical protein V1816_01155 [Pseudomonadota bacterium]